MSGWRPHNWTLPIIPQRDPSFVEPEAPGYQAGVSEPTQVQSMVEAIVKRFGRLDIGVANAAYSVRQAIVDLKWGAVQQVIAVTQFGVFHTCQLADRRMVEQETGGKVVIISSIQAELPAARSAAYNMAKAAINHFAATAANELARHHINGNVINPRWIDTPGERAFLQ